MQIFRRALPLLVLLCLPLTAGAQSSSTKEITLPTARVLVLVNAIAALDGPERIVKDGANERLVKDPSAYKFGPGFKIAMARNLTALTPIVEGYQKEIAAARASLIRACRCEIKDGSSELSELNAKNSEILAVPQKVNLFVFSEAELKLDANNIPVSVLAGLEPVVEFAK